MATKKKSAEFVAYHRVSTQRQGVSGLGLEAQEEAVIAYVRAQGGEMVGSYTEIESGKKTRKSKRPELKRALDHARQAHATLVVAKLDRLGRNLGFLCQMIESGVALVACDVGPTNTLTLHILAAVAQAEGEAISERTTAALAAKRERGEPMGTPANLTAEAAEKGRMLGSEATREAAKEAYASMLPNLQRMRDSGMSYRAMAEELNADGRKTRLGGAWSHVQVRNVLMRAEAETEAA